jgi:hypothetical protein
MGYRPPPPMISREEFRRRFRAGARTIEELDPALAEWFAGNKRESRRLRILTWISLALVLSFFLSRL